MPVEFKDLVLKARRKLSVPLGDADEIVFWWDPTKYTKKIHFHLQEVSRPSKSENGKEPDQDPFALADACIIPLVVEWDITFDGKPWTITADHCGQLGLFICQQMVAEIVKDMGSYGDSKKGSDAGLLTQA